jgi:NtrC-family two-component system sensor histidine kinase KinB
MNLRPRLALSHGLIIGLLCLISLVALHSIQKLAEQGDMMMSADAEAMHATERIRLQLGLEIAQLMRETLSAHNAVSGGSVSNSSSIDVRGAIKDARRYFVAPDQHQALDKFEQTYIHFENAMAIWRTGQMTPANELALPSDYDNMRQALVDLNEIKNTHLKDLASSARDDAFATFTIVGILAVLAVGIGLFATLRLVRSFVRPVDQLTTMAQSMAHGDFDVAYQPDSIDEFNNLGRHFEAMSKSLRLFRNANIDRLIAEQMRTTAVLENIGDGLVIFAENGQIERINGVAQRQLGVQLQEVSGEYFEDIGDSKAASRVREVLATGTFADAEEAEIRIERDGETRVLSYALHRFVEGEGDRPGAVMVIRDITTRRGIDKMRSDFVMRASHELRTPITSIRMGLGLLGETLKIPAGSRDAELFQTVQQEVERMTGLLADLLDLSRLRSGEHAMERAPTKIADLLVRARDRFAVEAANARTALEIEIDDGLPQLPLCSSAFDRVLDNLIANALRHTPAAGSIMLSAHRTPQHVAIAVTDTGQGIPYSQQSLIFQPFVQIGNKRGGAGLGLAICEEIVHQHGGEIQLSSVPGRGTTFTVLLPADLTMPLA